MSENSGVGLYKFHCIPNKIIVHSISQLYVLLTSSRS